MEADVGKEHNVLHRHMSHKSDNYYTLCLSQVLIRESFGDQLKSTTVA
jgi:hypothetical protein